MTEKNALNVEREKQVAAETREALKAYRCSSRNHPPCTRPGWAESPKPLESPPWPPNIKPPSPVEKKPR